MPDLSAVDPHRLRVVDDHVVDGAESGVCCDGDEAGFLAGAGCGGVCGGEGHAGLGEEGFGYCVILHRILADCFLGGWMSLLTFG